MANGQLTMKEFGAPEIKEGTYLEMIWPQLTDVLSDMGLDPEILTKQKTKSYTVVKLKKMTVCRLRLHGKQSSISIPTSLKDLIPDGVEQKEVKTEEKYIRVSVDNLHPLESYTSLLEKLVRESVNRYPKEWDCCSRYMECSDAKRCVHPDKGFALECGYRRILNSGRIFYGENRNVD